MADENDPIQQAASAEIKRQEDQVAQCNLSFVRLTASPPSLPASASR